MTNESGPALHRWGLDFTKQINVSLGAQPSRPSSARKAIEENQHPPGFPPTLSASHPSSFKVSEASDRHTGNTQGAKNVTYATSWQIANHPLRALVTSAFALFMAGSSVQFFSVASTLTVLFMHIRSILGTYEAFSPVRRQLMFRQLAPLVLWRAALSAIGIAAGLWKANQLGFLPTSESDWIALLPPRAVIRSAIRQHVVI